MADNLHNCTGTIGRKGEDSASLYLTERGHTIIERNWRSGHLEIDIISLDKDGIHFIEVKTRRPPILLAPQDCVTYKKQKNITTAAKRYLAGHDFGDIECHFDILAIIIDKDKTVYRYIQDAFIPVYV